MAPRPPPVRWSWSRFATLRVDDLYDALALRAQAFVVEQRCTYLDADGADRMAWHLLGRAHDGTALAYLRLIDPGCRYEEPSIGRVVVQAAARGTGLGRQLMGEGVRRCAAEWPGRAVRISAQARLQAFYASLGFVPEGPVYLEDGIDHVSMLKPGA